MILVAEFVRIWTFGCCVQSLTTSATPENPHFMVFKIHNGVAQRGFLYFLCYLMFESRRAGTAQLEIWRLFLSHSIATGARRRRFGTCHILSASVDQQIAGNGGGQQWPLSEGRGVGRLLIVLGGLL